MKRLIYSDGSGTADGLWRWQYGHDAEAATGRGRGGGTSRLGGGACKLNFSYNPNIFSFFINRLLTLLHFSNIIISVFLHFSKLIIL